MYASLRAFTDIFSGVFSSNAISITHTLSHSYDDNGLEKWWFRNTVTAVVKAANNRRMSVSPPELQLGVGAKAAELTNRKKGPFFSFLYVTCLKQLKNLQISMAMGEVPPTPSYASLYFCFNQNRPPPAKKTQKLICHSEAHEALLQSDRLGRLTSFNLSKLA